MGVLWCLQSTQPGLSFYSALPLAFGTSYYAISLGMNALLTALIIGRLISYRRRFRASSVATREQARFYVSLVPLTIESAMLYSVFAILFLATYGANNPINQVFLGFTQIAQVCFFASPCERR